jgi:hypothetical protein
MRFLKLSIVDVRYVVRALLPNLPVRPGVCRVCGCTESLACDDGCGWADRYETLCTACCPPPAPANRSARKKRRA